jgi:5'-nucleotidase
MEYQLNKKTILITNDDGYTAIGLKHLVEALKPIANIVIVAPTINQSACSHSMTLNRPLKIESFDDNSYIIDGTPTDCIFVSLHTLFKKYKPDLVISGINIGSNMGEDITYSGTVAGAMEAVLHKIPAIAISQVYNNLNSDENKNDWDFALAKKIIVQITQKIFKDGFPLDERKLLNINIPQIDIKDCNGIKFTNAGYRKYGDDIHSHNNPRGEQYHWIGLHPLIWQVDKNKSCDFEAIKENFVSITPIKLDLTSYEDITKLKEWI